MMPLSMVEEGKLVKILKIVGGRGLVLRLMYMGIKEGEIIRVLNNTRGPVLISSGRSRIALGRGISFRIFVEYAMEEEK